MTWLNAVFNLYINAANALAVEAATIAAAAANASAGADGDGEGGGESGAPPSASSTPPPPPIPRDYLIKSEFVEAVQRIDLTDTTPSQADLEAAFTTADVDGSGGIDRHEWRELYVKVR